MQSAHKLAVMIANGNKRVLVAEDDDPMRELIVEAMTGSGFDVIDVGTSALLRAEARRLATVHPPALDLVVTDLRMPGAGGLDALVELRALAIPTPVIVITAFGDELLRAQVSRLGAHLLAKPFPLEVLVALAHRTVDDARSGAPIAFAPRGTRPSIPFAIGARASLHGVCAADGVAATDCATTIRRASSSFETIRASARG